MLKARIIPCLLLHDGGLVKSEKFRNYKYIGDPINAIRIFNEKEVDELIFLDIDATRSNRPPDLEVVQQLTSECFMPFAYGGGIRTLDHIQTLLKIGVEKVIINHEALTNLSLVTDAARHFGSSTVIAAIDFKKDLWGRYRVYDYTKGKTTSHDPLEFARMVESAGAGEIFINNVDRDGTYSGFDLEIILKINKAVSVPVIACGGAGNLLHLKEVVQQAQVSAAAAGSLFVYQGPHRAVLISYPSRKLLEDLF